MHFLRKSIYLTTAVVVICVGVGSYLLANGLKADFLPPPGSHNPPPLYISPSGNDGNPGTLAQPFATIQGAQSYIRSSGEAGFTVYIRAGTYVETSTVNFTAADSGAVGAPNTWANYPGEYPVIVGSQNIPLTVGQSGTQTYNLGSIIGSSTPTAFYFDGNRQIVGRTPNYATPNFSASDPWVGQYDYTTGATPGNTTQLTYDSSKLDLSSVDLTQARVFIYSGTNYWADDIPIQSANLTTHVITLASSASSNILPNDRFFIENAPQLVDAPSEWYYNGTSHDLTIHLPSTVQAGDTLRVEVGYALVHLDSVQHFVLRGLDLEQANEGVDITASSDITLNGLHIQHIDGSGVDSNDTSQYVTVENNQINDTTENGVTEYQSLAAYKQFINPHVVITNNHIWDLSLVSPGQPNPIVFSGIGTTVTHNDIHDAPRMGISFTAIGATVSYNKIYNTGLTTTDGGGIYSESILNDTDRSWLTGNNTIDHNTVSNTGGYGYNTVASAWQYPYFNFGIYLDDYSSRTTVSNNIVNNVSFSCFHNHSGRDNTWNNNICANAGGTLGQQDLDEDDTYGSQSYMWDYVQNMTTDGYNTTAFFAALPHLASIPRIPLQGQVAVNNTFTHNIVYDPVGSIDIYGLSRASTTNTYDNNDYYTAGRGAIVSGSVGSGSTQDISLATWQGQGNDVHTITSDPLFMNMGGNDFSLTSSSPARALGIASIDTSTIGLQSVAPSTGALTAPDVVVGTNWNATWSPTDPNGFSIPLEEYRVTENTSGGTLVSDWSAASSSGQVSIATNGLTINQPYVICVRVKNDAVDPATGMPGVYSAVTCTAPITLARYAVCLQVPLQNRGAGQNTTTNLTMAIRDNGGGSNLVTLNNLVTDGNGMTTIIDPSLNGIDPSGTYTLWLKVPGYLARRIDNVAAINSGCLDLSPAEYLAPGDFNNDNFVTLQDIVIGIQAYQGNDNATTATAWSVYNGAPHLTDLVRVISLYHQGINGDQ